MTNQRVDNIKDSVRAVFFDTANEGYRYGTHGGTLFLIKFRGKVYALTCNHVFQDFERGRLFITKDKYGVKGTPPARIKGYAFATGRTDSAKHSDIEDICVVEFAPEMQADFFGNTPYDLNANPAVTSRKGEQLLVPGVLKEKTSIVPPDINVGYCVLGYSDNGAPSADPFLREAVAEFYAPCFSSVTGISGAPVFNVKQDGLCGMVVRGGMTGNKSIMRYVDGGDILRLLEAVSEKRNTNFYYKTPVD